MRGRGLWLDLLAAALFVGLLAALPGILRGAYGQASVSYLALGIRAVGLAVLALSWDLVARTGQLSLAHAAFYGAGGYAAAVLLRLTDAPVWAGIPLAGVVAAVLALALGGATLRLYGIYFAIGTLAFAEVLAEIEPFKTAIVLRFMRDWWFVLFALALIGAGLFVERFFCRYLCPLGAALAIPGRMRMFDWLKRYRECGNPCMRCFNECPVEAIHPEGHINPNECISCLHCQVLYHHDYKCPVRIQRRVKREKRAAVARPASQPAADAGATASPPATPAN